MFCVVPLVVVDEPLSATLGAVVGVEVVVADEDAAAAAAAVPPFAQLLVYHVAICARSLPLQTLPQTVCGLFRSEVRYPDWQKHDS